MIVGGGGGGGGGGGVAGWGRGEGGPRRVGERGRGGLDAKGGRGGPARPARVGPIRGTSVGFARSLQAFPSSPSSTRPVVEPRTLKNSKARLGSLTSQRAQRPGLTWASGLISLGQVAQPGLLETPNSNNVF